MGEEFRLRRVMRLIETKIFFSRLHQTVLETTTRGAHMGFRFQRRINLGGGWGVNTSGSGGSLSYRSRHGSIGTKGFSLRTGIPGLSYRQSWGKNAGGAALFVIAFMAALAFAAILIRICVYAVPLIWECVKWVALTLYDLVNHIIQELRAWRARSGSRP